MDGRYRKYEPFFGKWYIKRELGKGSFGRVYEIYWDDGLGSRSKSALKVIHIPSEDALAVQKETQPDMEAVRTFFLKQVERIKDEIRILQRCKGHSNIVSYEDHLILDNSEDGEFGWDILIRMELLYPLSEHFARKEATQYDVIQMWQDITNALIYCEDQGIIHRDIKPANILVSESGHYKLSDFGAARKSMQGQDASTRIGTELYMAPEVYKNQTYDKRADYYSLGRVIYFYLNFRRHAHLPLYPQVVDAKDYDAAEEKRLKGDKPPKIEGVSKEINNALMKSLAFSPADRYKSARELYQVIEQIRVQQKEELIQKWLDPMTKRLETESVFDLKPSHKSNTGLLIGAACLLMAVGVTGLVFRIPTKIEKDNEMNIKMDMEERKPEPGEQEYLDTKDGEETEIILPDTRIYGKLKRPSEGEVIDNEMGISGWILTSEEAGDIEAFADVFLQGALVESYELTNLKSMGENTFEKQKNKNAEEIVAENGYEIKNQHDISKLEEGDYTLEIRVVEEENGEEEVLDTISFSVSHGRTLDDEELGRLPGEEAEQAADRTYFLDEQKGFAIGMDENGMISANADQIIFTGWLNSVEGTGLSAFFYIDGEPYTRDRIALLGGDVLIEQVPRNIETIGTKLRGIEIQNQEEAGFIIGMKLPFLDAGEHTIGFSYNVAVPVQEVETVDLSPVSVTIDPSISIKENAVDAIKDTWARKMPDYEETEKEIKFEG